ncbi:MAG: hypothetical protein EHM58_03320 [Ignavibacteriae bacterium]|nr:MAG: hypothetical protein EHM58_03320 [Ignavibacteriota bacterium]
MESSKTANLPDSIPADLNSLPENYFTYVGFQNETGFIEIPRGNMGFYDIYYEQGDAPVIEIKVCRKDNEEDIAKLFKTGTMIRVYGFENKIKIGIIHDNTSAIIGYKSW